MTDTGYLVLAYTLTLVIFLAYSQGLWRMRRRGRRNHP